MNMVGHPIDVIQKDILLLGIFPDMLKDLRPNLIRQKWLAVLG